MNDSSNNPEEQQNSTLDEPQDSNGTNNSDILSDGIFSIKVSEDMALRNALRSGLVEAQGRNAEKIPMFVSWPHWLDDGIVCLFAKDLHQVFRDTVHNTASSITQNLEEKTVIDEQVDDFDSTVNEETDEKEIPENEMLPDDKNVESESSVQSEITAPDTNNEISENRAPEENKE